MIYLKVKNASIIVSTIAFIALVIVTNLYKIEGIEVIRILFLVLMLSLFMWFSSSRMHKQFLKENGEDYNE